MRVLSEAIVLTPLWHSYHFQPFEWMRRHGNDHDDGQKAFSLSAIDTSHL